MSDATMEPILYTQVGCAESPKVRAWLTARGIAFTERDASGNAEAALALAATGTFATPLLVAGEEKVLGFQQEALSALLRIRDDPARSARSGRCSTFPRCP